MHGREIKATWMRGGTSKCWVFDREELELPDYTVDEVLLRLFGSPDPRQVDGVGGGTSTTSKAVIVSPSSDEGVDVDYTFAQVGIEEPVVDWGSNCGNCSSVVGHYALRRGWVTPTTPTTSVRVRNTNTGQLIVLELDTSGDDTVLSEIPGVPFPGEAVRMWFVEPAGRTTGELLPTGRTRDELTTPHGTAEATLLDAGAPVVVIDARSVGLTGDEVPAVLDADPETLLRLDEIRRAGAVAMGMAATPAGAERAVPKLVVVSPAPEGSDLRVRMLSMGKVHPALAITGSVAVTMAVATPGTIAADLAAPHGDRLRISTPAGIVETVLGEHAGRPAVAVTRTMRELADTRLVIGPAALPARPAEAVAS
ncbi:methylitaconate delta2-delta3-isomerase [Aeromicrobium camelliae]|uniref:Methylitaconate delta2-delta3-isomerase n=1 Tax=Aeromicrobium camelliae TaxID=1538144 RepID=A0A3N6WSX6_9ACTN|nr:PrpF domain-containing protein [Aeromicrobium camelliae]RQN08122.1 methylitaconate delta2-delta3-isomerase [Aeromicrobium camelliae]